MLFRRPPPTSHTDKGKQAEDEAERYLTRQGLRLEQKNYRCRSGEIDLIMWHHTTLVFVEVRYRTHEEYGGAVNSITQRKQQRIVRAARHYLMRQKSEPPCRFDVVTFTNSNDANWIPNAFSVD